VFVITNKNVGTWQWHSKGADRPRQHFRKDGKNGVIRGHQASHDFWGQQNCSLPQAPITHATPLAHYWWKSH